MSETFLGIPEDILMAGNLQASTGKVLTVSSSSLKLVGSLQNPTVAKLLAMQSWDASFRAGDKGVLKLDFRVFSSSGKDWIARTISGALKAAGVQLWRDTYWEGSTLCVSFVTGLAPLAIGAIVLGASIGIFALLSGLSLYKYVTEVTKTNEEAQQREQDRKDEAQRAALDAYKRSGTPPEEWVLPSPKETEDTSFDPFDLGELGEKLGLSVAALLGLAVVAFVVIMLVRR